MPYFQVDNIQNGGQTYQIVQSSATTSVLTLWNVNWKHTGVYQCKDRRTRETKEVDIFVPGEACFVYLAVTELFIIIWLVEAV